MGFGFSYSLYRVSHASAPDVIVDIEAFSARGAALKGKSVLARLRVVARDVDKASMIVKRVSPLPAR